MLATTVATRAERAAHDTTSDSYDIARRRTTAAHRGRFGQRSLTRVAVCSPTLAPPDGLQTSRSQPSIWPGRSRSLRRSSPECLAPCRPPRLSPTTAAAGQCRPWPRSRLLQSLVRRLPAPHLSAPHLPAPRLHKLQIPTRSRRSHRRPTGKTGRRSNAHVCWRRRLVRRHRLLASRRCTPTASCVTSPRRGRSRALRRR